ncbi:hypothetical protein [Bradyrhizobium japonicum]|jgi:hypothetical protein|uniref:hypothetical protein n=1 Tax=Bradyrhizobium japonicum TaxID=375 RepID=UPI0020A04076|nr:hypothetical protein [Bradyrhizobium japonicum]MCP1761161.1 hypothetical protein [Bradyrhizobium japonicum]MCP1792740.1 hypothetical protein [Bradyrhizobium japonicum]MCP1805175.1 hypothetical protein [Bradyrhizobium japonicum]MCP1814192.1 hypothetical protein [Bradyrhizobium japonicum]MCP1874379.1 hypothetical protein [Bradyrhizobium japonicum]
MVGLLKIDGGRFWVEYEERNVQVVWTPGAPEPVAKARRWFDESYPRLEQVPETMLRSLIGSDADFSPTSVRKEKSVERHGKLSDGGSIKLVYFKEKPLSDSDYHEGVEALSTWISSYFR